MIVIMFLPFVSHQFLIDCHAKLDLLVELQLFYGVLGFIPVAESLLSLKDYSKL